MLTLYIKSFSYKQGLPNAVDQHGGGYVFDCRGLKNPGREAEFKDLTGQAKAVQNYIEQQPDAQKFWENVLNLIMLTLSNYHTRGFESLSVYFGCTGGQHRSVYFAEKLAEQLAQQSNLKIELEHVQLNKNNKV